MKKEDSKERLMDAILAEDARVPNNTPDQEFLENIDSQIEIPGNVIAPPLWKRLAVASCLILGLTLIGTALWKQPLKKETLTVREVKDREFLNEAAAPAPQAFQVNPEGNAKIAEGDLIAFGDSGADSQVESLSRKRQSSIVDIESVERPVNIVEPLDCVAPERAELGEPHNQNARHNQLIDQPFKSPLESPLSTFSIDTDRASYTNLRNNINRGIQINPDSVRIEELINAFSYDYSTPVDTHPFAVNVEIASCPWNTENRLVKVGLKGKEIDNSDRPSTNLVLLCDVSGSMNNPKKLGYLKASFMELIENLDERDTVSIVTYAGSEGIALKPTKADAEGRPAIFNAIETLRSGGSTNGEAGIKLAYSLANKNFLKGGVNRVLLATDGDFNVGVRGDEELLSIVKQGAKKGTYLTVLGLGQNLNDGMLEKITNDGDGQYFFIDSQQEGHRVFGKELTGTLVTIAKDVKIQVEFNPAEVSEYRLIGYANRQLKDEDFNNDRVDAGEIGAGHTVTALYEVVPGKAKPVVYDLKYGKSGEEEKLSTEPSARYFSEAIEELLTLKLRYKQPEGTQSTLMEYPINESGMDFSHASEDFRFASSIALYGMLLRNTEYTGTADFSTVEEIAGENLKDDPQRKEFLELVRKTKR